MFQLGDINVYAVLIVCFTCCEISKQCHDLCRRINSFLAVLSRSSAHSGPYRWFRPQTDGCNNSMVLLTASLSRVARDHLNNTYAEQDVHGLNHEGKDAEKYSSDLREDSTSFWSRWVLIRRAGPSSSCYGWREKNKHAWVTWCHKNKYKYYIWKKKFVIVIMTNSFYLLKSPIYVCTM